MIPVPVLCSLSTYRTVLVQVRQPLVHRSTRIFCTRASDRTGTPYLFVRGQSTPEHLLLFVKIIGNLVLSDLPSAGMVQVPVFYYCGGVNVPVHQQSQNSVPYVLWGFRSSGVLSISFFNECLKSCRE
jgi:hypothetical protein